jgi:hypothetical protein
LRLYLKIRGPHPKQLASHSNFGTSLKFGLHF